MGLVKNIRVVLIVEGWLILDVFMNFLFIEIKDVVNVSLIR